MIRVTIAQNDVTDYVGNLTWSNVDPGGFEAAAFELADAVQLPNISDEVVIWDGMYVLFLGFVEEPGDGFRSDGAPAQVNCVGAGTLLKDLLMSMIFVDSDLTRWGSGPSSARRISLLGTPWALFDSSVLYDATSPAVMTEVVDNWTTRADCESWYDAGFGNSIGKLIATWSRGPGAVNNVDTNWSWSAVLCSDDIATATDNSGNLRAAGPATVTVTSTGTRRWALLQLLYNIGGGAAGDHYPIWWTNVAVIGNHGITVNTQTTASGITANGLYSADIVRYVLSQYAQGRGITIGRFSPSTADLLVRQSAYYTPVTYEQIIDDMSKLSGFHWGVWEPLCPFTSDSHLIPRMDYVAAPTVPTVIVDREDCQLNLTQRTSDVYTSVTVQFVDVSGRQASVTSFHPDYRLSVIPIGISNVGRERELFVDIGTSDALNAQNYADDLMALQSDVSARGTGEGTLPPYVIKAPTGQVKRPSHFLRAGLDCIRINGLPNSARLTPAIGTLDTFRISRVSCAVEQGAVKTTVELDHGADLLEVLNARMAIATQQAGF